MNMSHAYPALILSDSEKGGEEEESSESEDNVQTYSDYN